MEARHGLRVVRQVSRTFTAGATIHDDNDNDATTEEQQPMLTRQHSVAAVASAPDVVQLRLSEEIGQLVLRSLPILIPFLIIVVALLVCVAVLMVRALIAVIENHAKPCDQPMKWYLLVSFLWGQVPGTIANYVAATWNEWDRLKLHWVLSLSSWGLIFWGIYMVNAVKTCPKTNPDLYYPTKHYIYGQAILSAVCVLMVILGLCGYRRLLFIINKLNTQPGCAQAVHKMPKIDPGSQDLVSPDDGKILACSICLEGLDKGGAVKTPCSHFFHEECLAHWCENHVDCPLCRQPVGEPDPSDQV